MRRRASVRWLVIVATIAAVAGGAMAQSATSVLFIGNSFTFGYGSPVRFYRSTTVHLPRAVNWPSFYAAAIRKQSFT